MRKFLGMVVCLVGILTLVAACSGQQHNQRFVVGRGDTAGDLQACATLSEKKKFEEAIECLEVYKSRYRGAAQADEAELFIGDNFFQKKDYLLAAESYDSFTKNHPTHPRADYALYRMGLAYLLEAPKAIDRDQQYLGDALHAFEQHLAYFPQSHYRSEVSARFADARSRLARRYFYIGKFYYRTGEYRAAVPRLETVVDQFGDLPEGRTAYLFAVRALLALGERSSAEALASRTGTRYSGSAEQKHVEKMFAKGK